MIQYRYENIYKVLNLWRGIIHLSLSSKKWTEVLWGQVYEKLSGVARKNIFEAKGEQPWWFQKEEATTFSLVKRIQHTPRLDSEELWKANRLRRVWCKETFWKEHKLGQCNWKLC